MSVLNKMIGVVTCLALGVSSRCISQNVFQVTISLDSAINAEDISCSIDEGFGLNAVEKEFKGRQLIISDIQSSFIPSIKISRIDDSNNQFSSEFFIDKSPAFIKVGNRFNIDESQLTYDTLINVTPVSDTSFNKSFKDLVNFRLPISQNVASFWKQNGGKIDLNDSLRQVARDLTKQLAEKDISYIRDHLQDYFSFWYFRRQVVAPALSLSKYDLPYLHHLLQVFLSSFPVEYVNSKEGKYLSETLKFYSNPPTVDIGDIAPNFILRSQNEQSIELNDYRGKYVLLDFWASWCYPCRLNNPKILELSKQWSQDELTIISISADENAKQWKEAILKDRMSWINLIDSELIPGKVTWAYAIMNFPTYILIDPEGVVRLRTVNDVNRMISEINHQLR